MRHSYKHSYTLWRLVGVRITLPLKHRCRDRYPNIFRYIPSPSVRMASNTLTSSGSSNRCTQDEFNCIFNAQEKCSSLLVFIRLLCRVFRERCRCQNRKELIEITGEDIERHAARFSSETAMYAVVLRL